MEWGLLTGPAVVAAVVSGIVTTVGMLVSRSTTIRLHAEKIDADQKLAERKFELDRDLATRRIDSETALAERKANLDRALADWKRRTEVAEQVLADFYKAKAIFVAARSPHAFAGEGSTRPRREGESAEDSRYRDTIFAPFERLSKEQDFFSELHARRYRFMALFGSDTENYFNTLLQLYNRLGFATRALISEHRIPSHARVQEFEDIIGWGTLENEDEDPFNQSINTAVVGMENTCRPVLEVKPI